MDVSSNQEYSPNFINQTPDGEFPPPIPLAPDLPTEEIDVYWIYDALADSIKQEGNTFYVTISYMEPGTNTIQRIRVLELFVSERNTRIFDQEKKSVLPKDLTVGMTIDVLVSSRVSNTNPPRAQAFQILITAPPLDRDATEGKIIQVNVRNNFLLIVPNEDQRQILRINLAPDTVIMNSSGRRVILQDLTPGLSLWVEHEPFLTATNPPQTTATIIQILN